METLTLIDVRAVLDPLIWAELPAVRGYVGRAKRVYRLRTVPAVRGELDAGRTNAQGTYYWFRPLQPQHARYEQMVAAHDLVEVARAKGGAS